MEEAIDLNYHQPQQPHPANTLPEYEAIFVEETNLWRCTFCTRCSKNKQTLYRSCLKGMSVIQRKPRPSIKTQPHILKHSSDKPQMKRLKIKNLVMNVVDVHQDPPLPLTTLPVTIPVANDIPVAAAAALPAPGLDQEVISEQVANRVQEMIESLVSSQAPNQQADLNENLIKKIEALHEEKVNALNSLLQQKERELSANNANINLMKQRIIDLVKNEKILNGNHPVLTNKYLTTLYPN